jgi:transposase InsO family protein
LLQRPIEFTQSLSTRYAERLADAGFEPSVGSRRDSDDNALAESVSGLFKTALSDDPGTIQRER